MIEFSFGNRTGQSIRPRNIIFVCQMIMGHMRVAHGGNNYILTPSELMWLDVVLNKWHKKTSRKRV